MRPDVTHGCRDRSRSRASGAMPLDWQLRRAGRTARRVTGETSCPSGHGLTVSTDLPRSRAGAWILVCTGVASIASPQIDLTAAEMSCGRTRYFVSSVSGYEKLACRGCPKLLAVTASQHTFEEVATEELDEPSVALLPAPGRAAAKERRTNLTLTRSSGLLLEQTLPPVLNATLESTDQTLTNSLLTGPVTTRVAELGAQLILVVGEEARVLLQKAVTVAAPAILQVIRSPPPRPPGLGCNRRCALRTKAKAPAPGGVTDACHLPSTSRIVTRIPWFASGSAG